MIKFEYDAEPEYEGHKHRVVVESSEDAYIGDIVSKFTSFLKSIGFFEPTIVDTYLAEIEDIRQNVKENHIMMEDYDED